MKLSRRSLLLASAALTLPRSTPAQNLALDDSSVGTAAPVRLSDEDVHSILTSTANPSRVQGRATEQARAKLERHVSELLSGAPWRPFHHTLGISGYEVYFDHPQQLCYSLSLATPFLAPDLRKRVREYLTKLVAEAPPHRVEGADRSAGRPRERYEVPEAICQTGSGQTSSLFGVYAYSRALRLLAPDPAGARARLSRDWDGLINRVHPLLNAAEYPFDLHRKDYSHDEAQRLNGDLAGLIGLWSLARLREDVDLEKSAFRRIRQLLELRVNLDRVNPRILENTLSSTRHLHIAKLARYCDLIPEVGDALARFTEGLAARRLQTFRQTHPGWHLAFGERLIGGENYTNPPHLAHALFNGAALVEKRPPSELFALLDIPWCRADLYFIEKCALALQTG